MSRIVRLYEPSQPILPLGHGPVQWDTLPPAVRDRVVGLWIQLLQEHLSRSTPGIPSGNSIRAIATRARGTEEFR